LNDERKSGAIERNSSITEKRGLFHENKKSYIRNFQAQVIAEKERGVVMPIRAINKIPNSLIGLTS